MKEKELRRREMEGNGKEENGVWKEENEIKRGGGRMGGTECREREKGEIRWR